MMYRSPHTFALMRSIAAKARWACLIVPLLIAQSGCDDRPAKPEPKAQEVVGFQWKSHGAECGFDFHYRNGEEAKVYAACEVVGGGVGVIDFDQDGRWDLALPGGGKFPGNKKLVGVPSQLFRNLEPWKYENVSLVSGCSNAEWYSHGVAVGDYDNDGFPDLLISCFGGLHLYRNQGDGTFQDFTSTTGLIDTQWATSAAWLDGNGDGFLDLYVAHYDNWSFDNDPPCYADTGEREPCGPGSFQGLPDSYFVSNGEGGFSDQSKLIETSKPAHGLAVVASDLDRDGDTDIYVANDADPNFQFRNDGSGKFAEVAVASGTALGSQNFPDGSMGIAAGDFDGDGQIDLWISNFQKQYFELYQNQGEAFFTPATRRVGLVVLGTNNVGWGNVMADMDHDGDLDFIVVNGHVERHPTGTSYRQLPILLENIEGKRLQRVEKAGEFFENPQVARGLAQVDLDRDGDLDLACSTLVDAGVLLENKSAKKGESLSVKLIGRFANRDAIGATVELRLSDKVIVRQICGGGSFGTTHCNAMHFGFPTGSQPKSLKVYWPGSKVHEVTIEPGAREIVVIEP